MLEYFNRKEDNRYLTFKRKRFVTLESSRRKISYDKKKKILWIKPPGLIGKPLLMEKVDKITYQARERANDGKNQLVGEINVIIKGKKILVYDVSIDGGLNLLLIKEHLIADLRAIIGEIVYAFKEDN